MLEILTMGNIKKDFDRIGIQLRQTYKGKEYGVCEVTDKELDTLCDDPDIPYTWIACGWRYCEGSNQEKPSKKVLINNKEIIAWYDDIWEFDSEEEKQAYLKEHNGIIEPVEYTNLLEYLCDEMGCCQPINICALTKDLAKYNNMKLSELFKIYQG